MTVKISGDLKGGYLLLTQKLLNFSSSAKSALTLQKSRVMWFNLNGHHAKSNQQESEVSDEPKTRSAKLYQRV